MINIVTGKIISLHENLPIGKTQNFVCRFSCGARDRKMCAPFQDHRQHGHSRKLPSRQSRFCFPVHFRAHLHQPELPENGGRRMRNVVHRSTHERTEPPHQVHLPPSPHRVHQPRIEKFSIHSCPDERRRRGESSISAYVARLFVRFVYVSYFWISYRCCMLTNPQASVELNSLAYQVKWIFDCFCYSSLRINLLPSESKTSVTVMYLTLNR